MPYPFHLPPKKDGDYGSPGVTVSVFLEQTDFDSLHAMLAWAEGFEATGKGGSVAGNLGVKTLYENLYRRAREAVAESAKSKAVKK